MSKLISLSIDVTKIDKTKLYKGAKGTYLNVDVWIDETADEDWKMVSANQSQSKEEREAKQPKNYIGNGKLVYGWDDAKEVETAPDPVTEEDCPF
jgi:hypothetical protein